MYYVVFLKNVHLQEGNPPSKLTFFGTPGMFNTYFLLTLPYGGGCFMLTSLKRWAPTF